MDAELRREAATLRIMGSEKAAEYLIQHYPRGSRRSGDALVLVQHLSWRVADQMRLARHYLGGQPHASARVFEAFASFMSLRSFAQAVRDVWPERPDDQQLFRYNLGTAIRKYETSEANTAVIDALLNEH
ncbi:hypothetical protein [Brevundimonas sp. Root1279]|uniref:hypothetical protein n=1 Tax=Brevundimonas sp. Root1279 TaxID=1736443 RepID=UPI0006F2D51D|nr:hypothetical protein [Brevundimonas sp. Root1279]KQW82986.1 hypothetical protein ASC65_06505 [Brevundimonas sp. Root1279]